MAVPRYIEIKEQIRDEIQGKPVNSPIPSERDLAVKYDASRMTVRNAVNELVEEGILYRDKNKGTFVADQKLIKKNTATEILQTSESHDFNIIYFSIKNAEEVASVLDIDTSDQILRIVRLNKVDGRPLSIEEVYFIKGLLKDEDVNDLRSLLDIDAYIEQGTVTQRFHAVIVPAQYANILHLKITVPVIMIESIIRSKNGKPLVFIRAYNNPFEKTIEITT